MAKRYIDKLSEWVDENKQCKSKTLASFIAQKNDIEEAIKSGYSAYIIWQHQTATGTLKMSYRQFSRYVKKHISFEKTKSDIQEKNQKPKTTGFTFNSVPNKEELY